MIAKYILFVAMNTHGSSSSYTITTQEFYSLKQCNRNADFLKQDGAVRYAYCTEK